MENNHAELYTKLTRLQWLLQRKHMQTHIQNGPTGDPTRGQGRVLAALRMQPEIATKDLSYLLGIRQQSLNELLNKLEKTGYITREPSQADRRVMMVKITEKGKVQEQPPPAFDYLDAFSCLSEEEQSRFGEYLDRIIGALESHLSDEGREEIRRWACSARSRMGHEQFDRLLSAWGSAHAFRGDPRFRMGRPGDAPFHHGPSFGDFERDHRGPAPEGAPGEERFDPEYDDPTPEGPGPHPYRNPGHTPPPPPPPKCPHDDE